LLTNSNDQMATIAQLYTDRKRKNPKEVMPHFLTLRQLGPYEKTTRTINNYCCLTDLFLIKLTEIIKIQSSVKSIVKCKQQIPIKSTKTIFHFSNLWSQFAIAKWKT
jgi:hypothetical protein